MDPAIRNQVVYQGKWSNVTVGDIFDEGFGSGIKRVFKSIFFLKNLFSQEAQETALKIANLQVVYEKSSGTLAALYQRVTGKPYLFRTLQSKIHQARDKNLIQSAQWKGKIAQIKDRYREALSLHTKQVKTELQKRFKEVQNLSASYFTLCSTNKEVQKRALSFSEDYMSILQPLQKHFKQAEEELVTFSKEAGVLPAGFDPRQIEEQIRLELADIRPDFEGLMDIFRDDVKRKRSILLYTVHKNGKTNRDLVRGAGANNTYHIPSKKIADLPPLLSKEMPLTSIQEQNLNISKYFDDAQAVVILRSKGKGVDDGIGAMGGLAETTRRMFSEFDENQFNTDPDLAKVYLQSKQNEYEQKVASQKEPYNDAVNNHAAKTAHLLIQYLDSRKDAEPGGQRLKKLQEEIKKHVDDVNFDENGNVQLETDLIAIGKRAAERETDEESGEIGALEGAVKALRQKSGENMMHAFGGSDHLVDDNFFLTQRGITASPAPAQCVSPMMFTTEVSPEAMAEFARTLQASKGKLINPISHGEVAGCQVISLNELRRRNGVLPNGKLLSEQVNDSYAYRYPHEHMGTAVKLTISQIAAQIPNPVQLKAVLFKLAKEDQEAVLNLDPHKHQISYLAEAKAMFAKDIAAMEKGEESEEAFEMRRNKRAYELLAEELAITYKDPNQNPNQPGSDKIIPIPIEIMADILEAMDSAAAGVYAPYKLQQLMEE